MKKIHILAVGKLSNPQLNILENDYKKRISRFDITIHEIKDHKEDLDKEAQEVLITLKKINPSYLVGLTEDGKEFGSKELANWLEQTMDNNQSLAFIIGGSAGHGKEIMKQFHMKLSFSKLTFPHQFCRVLLMEQIYRSCCLLTGHPYHK